MGTNRITPFAQLEVMQKRASAQPFPYAQTYQPGRVPDALPNGQAPAAAPGMIKHPGVIDNMWGDIAVSSVPVLGSVYMANKAIGDFRNGNVGSGLGNLLWAGLGVLPGMGAIKGGLGALRGLGKGVGALGAAKSMVAGGWRGAAAANPLGIKGTIGAMGAGIAAPMLLDPSQPQQQPQQPTYQPQQPAAQPGFIQGSINAIKGQQGTV